MRYSSWDTECDRQYFVILGHFLCFYPTNSLKKTQFGKNEKGIRWCHQFTHLYQKSHHMMYASWDIACNRHIFLSFLAIFCPFTPLLTLKIKIWEKCKKNLEILSLNEDHMMYGSWDIRHNGQRLLSFWVIFCPFTLLKH